MPLKSNNWNSIIEGSHFSPKSKWNMGVDITMRNPIAGKSMYAVKRFIFAVVRENLSASSCTCDNTGRNDDVRICDIDIIPILLHLSDCV